MPLDIALSDLLREYSDGGIGQPDLERIRSGYRETPQTGNIQRLLVAAVFLLIAAGAVVLAAQNLGGGPRQVPIAPSPSPAETTPSQSRDEFAINLGKGVNPGPVGGVGDTIDGLRLEAVEITTGRCRDEACPSAFIFTVTNTTDVIRRWEVAANQYRNGYATLGEASQIELAPGKTGTIRIELNTRKSPSDGGRGTYTWNWSAWKVA